MSNLYTNTSKPQAVLGLIVTTVLLSYAATNSTKLVNDTVSLVKKGIGKVTGKVNGICHGNKKKYIVCGRDIDGNLYEIGTIWK